MKFSYSDKMAYLGEVDDLIDDLIDVMTLTQPGLRNIDKELAIENDLSSYLDQLAGRLDRIERSLNYLSDFKKN